MIQLPAFLKNKRTQNILLGALVLLVLYILFKDDVDAFFKKLLGIKTTSANPSTTDFDKLLRKGTSGEEVFILQEALETDGASLPKFGTDGIFGNETENALMSVKGVRQITLNDYRQGSAYDFAGFQNLVDVGMIA